MIVLPASEKRKYSILNYEFMKYLERSYSVVIKILISILRIC